MPLEGEAKKRYQKDYMNKRRSNKPNVRPDPENVRPITIELARATYEALQAKTDNVADYIKALAEQSVNSRQSKLVELRTLMDTVKTDTKPTIDRAELPIYDRNIHKPGDNVRLFVNGRWQEMVVPELDADGTPLEAPSPGHSYSFNEFVPAYKPYSKPEKKIKLGKGKKGGS